MKTATTNAAQSRAIAAIAPPPPPAKWGLIRGAFLAAVAALALAVAPPAEAQTATLTFSASVNGGPACTDCRAEEGDTVSITFDTGLTSGAIGFTRGSFGGTADQGQDYSGIREGGEVVWPSRIFNPTNGYSHTQTYTLTDDDATEGPEPDETITLAFPSVSNNPGGITVDSSGAGITITILANDGYSRVSLGGADATLSEGATVNVPVNFQDTAARSADAMVAFSITGTATAADYAVTTGGGVTFDATAATGSITVAASATAGAIPITITADSADDEGETLIVTLTSYTGGGSGILQAVDSATRTYTLVDSVRTLTVTCSPASVTEGASATCTIALADGDTAFTSPTAVTWTVTHGDTVDADFAAVTGSVMFPTATTFALTPADDDLDEDAEAFTVQLSVADATADSGTAFGAAASISIADNDTVTVTLTGPDRLGEGEMGTYTVNLGAIPMAAVTVTYSITGEGSAGVTTDPASPLTITPPATTATLTLTTDDGGGRGTPDRTFTIAITDVSGGATPAGRPSLTVTVSEDDPAAREARLEAPLASAGRGVGQLAAEAIQQRLAHGAGGGNSLTLAGRNIANSETLAAEYLAGGYATSAADLLRSSGFNLAAGDGGRGLNFWGGGAHVSAKGKHDGVDYDGDTSAFTLGVDAGWRSGLIGVAVARSDGDADFTVIADGMESTLETAVTSAHPYLTRRFGKSQLWLTAGYGSGDAELIEPDATIKTDITVTTAALGLTRAEDAQLSGGISALYTRAELDAAVGGGKTLNATTAASLRVAASAQARWTHGAWSPFLDFALRHDSGDGDTGIAGDVGGGLEWDSPTVQIRLAVSASASAESAEESRASFTVRKSAGDFTFGLDLGADGDGVDAGRLLTGEWRF